MTETLILSWNTGQTDFPVDVIEGLAKDSEADVIVLPEHFGPVATGELGDWAGLNGFQILSYEGSTSSVLVSERLGPYSVDTEKAPPWARFLAIAEFSSSPRLVIAHLEHARLWSAGLWNEHLGWAGLGCSRVRTGKRCRRRRLQRDPRESAYGRLPRGSRVLGCNRCWYVASVFAAVLLRLPADGV